MGLFKRIGVYVVVVLILFGGFCCFDLIREFNIKSIVLGYIYNEPEIIKIDDFNYKVTSLLFTKTEGNDNQYYAVVNTNVLSGFDKTKRYIVKINGLESVKNITTHEYIDCDFTNRFYSANDKLIKEDTLNIKINFYNDGTKILFITNNGEEAVKLWASYIQKNGFVLNIVEDNFEPQMEVEGGLTNYNANLYCENKLIKTMLFNAVNQNLPMEFGSCIVKCWKDKDGNIIKNGNLPLRDIDLYAELSSIKFTINSNLIKTIELNNIDIQTIKWRYFVYSKPINTMFDYEYSFLKQFKEDETKFDMSIKMNNFYGNSYTLSSCGENHNSFGFTYTYYSNEQKCDKYLNLVITMSIKEITEDYFIPKLTIYCEDNNLWNYSISKNENEMNELLTSIKQDLDNGKISFSLECVVNQLDK